MAYNIVLIVGLFCLIFSPFTNAQQALVPAVFLLGDSMIDVGNNNYLITPAKANFKHHGIDFPTGKSTGRFSNGKNAAEFIADKLGFAATQPAYLELKNKKMDNDAASFMNGVNFASAGAGVFNYTLPELLERIPFSKQVEYYTSVYKTMVEELGESGAHQRISKSLFVISLGPTDLATYNEWITLKIKYTIPEFLNLAISTLKPQMKKLYDNGARKFMFPGLPVLGCLPTQRVESPSEECNEESNFWARKFNEALRVMLMELNSQLEGFSYSYLDTFAIMQNILRNPAKFGFTDIKSACCGLGKLNARVLCLPYSNCCSNRNRHFFWDMFHPSEAAVRIIVDTFFNNHGDISFPITLKQLIAM